MGKSNSFGVCVITLPPLVCVYQTPPFQAILGRLPGTLIIARQAPPVPSWDDWNWQDYAMGIAEFLADRYVKQRVVATGFSRDGLGVLRLISAYPDLVQACAAVDPQPARDLEEILNLLGLFLGNSGGPGGEFLYSTPGYIALIDAAARVGGSGVPDLLNAQYQSDLVALKSKVNAKTRAIYLINPHNPTRTINDDEAFKSFLRETSQRAVVPDALAPTDSFRGSLWLG